MSDKIIKNMIQSRISCCLRKFIGEPNCSITWQNILNDIQSDPLISKLNLHVAQDKLDIHKIHVKMCK